MSDGGLAAFKEETKRSYETYLDAYERSFAEHFEGYVKPFAQDFVNSLHGKTILDVGSGPGTHAQFFYTRGLDVICVDYSEEMLKRCRVKGVKTLLLDLEELRMPDRTIDGIWMYTSLIHVMKERVPHVVQNMARMLKSKGILGLAVQEGEKDGWKVQEKYPDTKRWFSYFTDPQVREYFSPHFEFLGHARIAVPNGPVFLNYLMRKY